MLLLSLPFILGSQMVRNPQIRKSFPKASTYYQFYNNIIIKTFTDDITEMIENIKTCFNKEMSSFIEFFKIVIVVQMCLTLCNPMDCSMPGFPVLHHLPELAQIHVHLVNDAIQPSCPVIPFFSCLQTYPPSMSFLMSQFFASGGQSIGVSASASVLSMNIQD